MNSAHRLHHGKPHFDMVSAGLILLTIGLLILIVGALLPLELTLLIQWLNLCGLLLIYIAVAFFVGLFKAKVDDFTGKGDSLF